MMLPIVMLCLLTQLLLAPFVYAAGKEDSAKNVEGVLDHVFVQGKLERTYKIHIPKDRAENAPLLFVLHGMGMTSDWTYAIGFNELADQHGYVVVYPQSLAKTIYLSEFLGMRDAAWLAVTSVLRWNNENADDRYGGASDVDFLSELARHLQKKYQLNPAQTFVAGFSNGGYMSYTLMCQAGETFRGAGIVAGLMDGVNVDGCAPSGPKPLIHLHGTADSMVPIEGREAGGKDNLPAPSAHDAVKYFAKLNNTTLEAKVKVSANTTAYIYRPEDDGAESRFYRIEGFIHYWPGAPYVGDKQLVDNSGVNATELIWEFFSQY